MIELIGAPFDLCGMRLGSRLGPAAIRLAGLSEELSRLGLSITDSGDIRAQGEFTEEGGLRNFQPLTSCVAQLRQAVSQSLKKDNLPLVMGGEHALVMGGISAALHHFEGDLGVVWIDAHADVNTPGSSETGNIHGMPLAALACLPSETSGVPDREWRHLQAVLGVPHLKLEHVAWYGLRDVDPAERTRLHGLPITMHHIDLHGVGRTAERIDEFLRSAGVKNVWVSFDVDALDPILAPGTGTAVRGGLTYREGHLFAELLHEQFSVADCPYRLVGLDVVETNPLYDTLNQTANMVVEWVASLLGKTTLGPR